MNLILAIIKRPAVRLAAVLAALLAVLAAGRIVPDREFTALREGGGFRILDRHGAVLRTVDRDKGLWTGLDEVSPELIMASLYSEDRRFYLHPGVDPLALGRALLQNVRSGRTVSGGSTITMQLARMLLGPRPRGFKAKLEEAALALYIEWRLPKDRILELYLNQAPYGGRARGCQAASQYYFNIAANALDMGRSAWLAVLPRNPRWYDPAKRPARAEAARQRLLEAMERDGIITGEQYETAVAEVAISNYERNNFQTPHFCDWVLAQAARPVGDLHTTVDGALTEALEKHLRAYVKKLSGYGISNAAVVVLDNRDLSLLAMVGSADYFNSAIDGQVNGAAAPRQPGSALKPFTYGLAMERGFPASYLLPDIDIDPGRDRQDFIPRNYDERYHGPVRIRTALGCSYNIAAVRILERIGLPDLLDRLHRAGFKSLKQSADHYGLGLTLGNGEVTLVELARAYAAIAGRGWYREVRFAKSEKLKVESERGETDSVRIFSEQVAYILAQILSDRSARQPAFGECSPLDLPFPCAAKTGTTKDYRDNWTAGFTTDYTVAVWLGNFDGRPMHGVSGITGAGPLFRDIMLTMHRKRRPEAFVRPEGIEDRAVCPLSGDLATGNCPNRMSEVFLAGRSPKVSCRFHDAAGRVLYPPLYRDWAAHREGAEVPVGNGYRCYIAFPKDGDVFKIDPRMRPEQQQITLKAVLPGPVEIVQWTLDGEQFSDTAAPRWQLKPGRHILALTARTSGGAVRRHRVMFTVLL